MKARDTSTSGLWILEGEDVIPVATIGQYLDWRVENGPNFSIAQDIRGDIAVSTAFIGIDPAYAETGLGRPRIFETVILSGPKNKRTFHAETWNEAMENHRKAVAMVKATQEGK